MLRRAWAEWCRLGWPARLLVAAGCALVFGTLGACVGVLYAVGVLGLD